MAAAPGTPAGKVGTPASMPTAARLRQSSMPRGGRRGTSPKLERRTPVVGNDQTGRRTRPVCRSWMRRIASAWARQRGCSRFAEPAFVKGPVRACQPPFQGPHSQAIPTRFRRQRSCLHFSWRSGRASPSWIARWRLSKVPAGVCRGPPRPRPARRPYRSGDSSPRASARWRSASRPAQPTATSRSPSASASAPPGVTLERCSLSSVSARATNCATSRCHSETTHDFSQPSGSHIARCSLPKRRLGCLLPPTLGGRPCLEPGLAGLLGARQARD